MGALISTRKGRQPDPEVPAQFAEGFHPRDAEHAHGIAEERLAFQGI
jgi:hypothetical protein